MTIFAVIGSIVTLDGRRSFDPSGAALTYSWSFVNNQIPIGSGVIQEGFKNVESDGSVVSFSPDKVGEYIIGLVVSNGTFTSTQVINRVSVRAIAVPHGRGLVPDGKFIWSYIRDAWQGVDNKEWFETLWSALIQIIGSEMLKLYQTDFNKSIKDAQDEYQRRWLSYEPKLDLVEEDLTFYVGTHFAGTDASTNKIGLVGQGIILNSNEVIVVQGAVLPSILGQSLTILYSNDSANLVSYPITSLNNSKTGYKLGSSIPDTSADSLGVNKRFTFTLQSTSWTNVDAVNLSVGDIISYPAGINLGYYTVMAVSGSTITVNKLPPSYSDLTSSAVFTANTYRPVGISISQADEVESNSAVISYSSSKDITVLSPGRLIALGGKAYPILKAFKDNNQGIPVITISSTDDTIPTGLTGLSWRTPHTITSLSQNFEALGVTSGDLIVVDVIDTDSNISSEVNLQVVGVNQYSIGVVITDQPIQAGVIPPVTNDTYISLTNDLKIPGLVVASDGSLLFSSSAKDMNDLVNSLLFQRQYSNQPLTTTSDFQVLDSVYNIRPKYIVRCSKLAVDDSLRSVPVLQQYIQQPDVSVHDGGVFQLKNGVEYPLPGNPVVLFENNDFIIDDEEIETIETVFQTGTNVVVIEQGNFVDRNVKPGDQFIIQKPISIQGSYTISSVVNQTTLILTRPTPLYPIGNMGYVFSTLNIVRGTVGRFIRFIPGAFSATNPPPNRLWAEVSFFDNSQAIENNFGILVGLTKADLDTLTDNIPYRQAVEGLMYALTKGSALNKLRLGIQILLGLPFSENRGIIRSIEPNYRLDINGIPIQGRLFIEDIDANNIPQGLFRIYLYPLDQSSDLSGIDINPETGVAYAVGDTVEEFIPLSKGVSIEDYISDPLSFLSVSQYHTTRVRINNTVFTPSEIDLVSSFLTKITPSYISYVINTSSGYAENVLVNDILISTIKGSASNSSALLMDNASFSIDPTIKLDAKTLSTTQVLNISGKLYWLRAYSRSLTTTNGSTSFVASNNIVPPGVVLLDTTVDVLYVTSGPNKGFWNITSSPNSTTYLVTGTGINVTTATNQEVLFLREISESGIVTTATVTGSNGASSILSSFGHLKTAGVSIGDRAVIQGLSTKYTVTGILESSTGSGSFDTITITPALAANLSSSTCTVYRPSLMPPMLPTSISFTSTGTNSITTSAAETKALIDLFDELEAPTGIRYLVLDSANLYVTPIPPAGTANYYLHKTGRGRKVTSPSAIFSANQLTLRMNQMDEDPGEMLEVRLSYVAGAGLTMTASSAIVTFTAPFTDPTTTGALPGDLLQVNSGGNSTVDVGHGVGLYPIVKLTSTNMTLSIALTNTGTSTFKIVRRR